MELAFSVFAFISKSPHEVFEAVADPRQLSKYFTTGGALGRLESGATVTWDFADFPGAFPVEVVEVVPDARIVLRWKANEPDEADVPDYRTEVVFAFAPLDDGARTKVTVSESGWRETPGGLKASFGNCMGWAQMLCALKCWVERGFNLREGMYK
ncbi:MAG: SRPBCC domain-containing protein [Novosphingobium sp.]|nr:SRPBCC domain-containing protein [Novosphingobium sp.]